MPTQSKWSLAAPQKLTFDEPVTALKVRIVGGTVNVVGTDSGPARLELTEIEGPPLAVTHTSGTLTVTYDDVPWTGFLKWFDPKERHRRATVTLTVPTATPVDVGTVSAGAVVSRTSGDAKIATVSGEATLVGLTGTVRADTVSGRLEAQSLGGELRFNSVSGSLTLIETEGGTVKADSVSGDMLVDLSGTAGTNPSLTLTSVSGEIAIRLPHPVDAEVEANTASGAVSCAFEDLRVGGQWGAKRITGRLGTGDGRLKITTVSGGVALLRRPADSAGPGPGPAEGKVL